jgi:hypothetical protein
MAAVPTTITEKPRKVFEPRPVAFPDSVKEEIARWLERHIESRIKRNKVLHETKVPEWRRYIEGTPKEEHKSWPFPECSNLVHQLIGESCDDLAARVLQLIWLTSPIVYFKYLARMADPKMAEEAQRKESLLNTFIDFMAYDPRELDLYPRENRWFSDSAGLGKAYLVIAPERREEAVYVGYENKKVAFDSKVLYEGPCVVNERFENILNDPDCDIFEKQDPIIRRITLGKRQLQEKAFKGFFDKEKVKEILGHPDRYGPTEVKRREHAKRGISDGEDDTLAEWDIYENYFSWYHKGAGSKENDTKFRLIAWYHKKQKKMLNCVYNFIPDNQVPIVETRLSHDGRGYAQILKDNQDEVSTAKNQRNDAITWAILGINTLSRQNKEIDRNFKLWPGILLRANKDDFTHHEVGNPAMSAISLQNEGAMIQQARERAGIAPAVSGQGTGGVQKKGAGYSAMGTLAVMQDSNTRTSHRQSDFRHSHVKALALITDFYGFMGLGRKGDLFGLDEHLLTQVLEDVLHRKVRIPMRAATASMNNEVTKQSEMQLSGFIDNFIKNTSQRLQAVTMPTASPQYKQWLLAITKGSNEFMRRTIKHFQLSDHPEEFIPDIPDMEPQNAQPTQGTGGGGPAGPGPAGIGEMANVIQGRGFGGGTAAPPGLPAPGGGLPGMGQ